MADRTNAMREAAMTEELDMCISEVRLLRAVAEAAEAHRLADKEYSDYRPKDSDGIDEVCIAESTLMAHLRNTEKRLDEALRAAGYLQEQTA